MFNKTVIVILLCLLCSTEVGYVQAHSNSPKIEHLSQIKNKTNFEFLLPINLNKDWIVEVYDVNINKNKIDEIKLHYFDKNDNLKLSIVEKKAKMDFKELEDYGENIKLSDTIAVFHALSPTNKYKDIQGGTLSWIQDGTLISIYSSRLTKDELINISKTVKK